MIVGSVVKPEKAKKLDDRRLSSITEVALEAITTNPVIDHEIRKNLVIMKELKSAVVAALRRSSLA